MKRRVILLLAFSVLMGTLVGCGNKSELTEAKNETVEDKSEPTETDEVLEQEAAASYEGLKIRLSTKSNGTVFGLSEKLGFLEDEFAKDGIEVEVTAIENGPAFIDAIAADQVDFGIYGDQPIISAYANGKPVKVVGISSDDTGSYQLIASDASGIENGADLEGKRIAYTAGTTVEKITKRILEAEGLTENDVELVNVSGVNSLTLLASGDIDATVYSQYSGSILDYDGYHKVADYAEYGRSVHVIAANTKFIEAYPELTERVLQVLDRTQNWMKENREEAIALIKDAGEYTDAQAELTYNGETWEITNDEDAVEVLNQTAQFLYDIDVIDHEVTTDEFMDTQYLQESGVLE